MALTKVSGDVIQSGSQLSVSNINATGVVTATTFVGDGSGLIGVVGSGSGVVVRNNGSIVGTAGTINFSTNLSVTPIVAGVTTVSSTASSSSFNVLDAYLFS